MINIIYLIIFESYLLIIPFDIAIDEIDIIKQAT